jgi:hypothetical protein
MVGVRMELLNSNDEVVLVTNEITQAKNYYRFDGDQIGNASFSNTVSTTAVINDSSNTESLTEVADLSTLDYLFSKMRLIRTSGSNPLRIKEFQMFINDDNKAPFKTRFTSVSGTSDIYKMNDDNFGNLYFSSFGTIGNYTGIDFGAYFSKYDIQSIVHYNKTTNRNNAIGISIELLNANDNIRVSSSEISLGKNYYRFDGPRIGDATFSNTASTTAVIDDSANTESLTGL